MGARVILVMLMSSLIHEPARADWFRFDRPLDPGGNIATYLSRIAESSREQHVIAGDCMSACTLWLGHPNACVTKDALLWFHAARDELMARLGVNPWRGINRQGNALLLGMYPPRVREVVRPWLESPDFHTLNGMELAALGVPLCSSAS